MGQEENNRISLCVKPIECFISRGKGGVKGGKELKQRVQRGFHYRRTEKLLG